MFSYISPLVSLIFFAKNHAEAHLDDILRTQPDI